MNDLVSIIVPVYNVERYLPECLNSLIHQTYQRLEIIIVDDESPDGSPAICDKYALADDRVKVHHVKNGGVSRARNYGVAHATGEWIMFLDSDDYLDLNTIEKLLECSEKYDADIVSCSYYTSFVNNNYLVGNDDGRYEEQNIDVDAFIRDMVIYPQKALKNYPTCLVPWGKIVKRKLFLGQTVSFPLDLHPHEDALFNVELFKKAKKQAYVHIPLLYYRQRNNASTKSKTKDNFQNNKLFCKYAALIQDSKGKSIFTDDEYAVTCTKYLVYGMINLWAFSSGNRKKAKEQLLIYMNDPLYSEQLSKAKNVDISTFGFSKRLRLSVDAARKKQVGKLLLYAKLSDIRALIKEKNPINGKKIYA